jgi:hypothetical protein
MYEYCVSEQSRALNALDAYKGPIRERCNSEWGTNYEMVLYCVTQQTRAQQRVASSPKEEIAAHCASEWSEDFEMRDYCEEEQHKAKARLQGQSGSLYRHCESEWGVQYDMIEHCIAQGG